jgi:phytoene dehydrogenase-like protein
VRRRAPERLVDRWASRPVREGYESKVDAVIDVLPRPRGLVPEQLAALGVSDPLRATMVVAPGLDAIAAAHAAAGQGGVAAEPLFLSNVPSVLDPTVAPPPGGHVFSLEVLFTPYRLAGGWSGSEEPERWLGAFARRVEPGTPPRSPVCSSPDPGRSPGRASRGRRGATRRRSSCGRSGRGAGRARPD